MHMFLWPWVLVLVLLLPVLFWWFHRRSKRSASVVLLYPYLSLLWHALNHQPRQYLAATFFGLALLLAVVAVARPMMAVPQIDPSSSIILAVDISRSMRTEDISPNRFEAAKVAIYKFVRELPNDTRVGLVAFADAAVQVSPISDNHEGLLEAVDFLEMGYGTAIGEAMVTSLASFPTLEERAALGEPQKLATIILLSDGRNQMGISPLEAVKQAKEQQVTIHTIGIGNPSIELPLGAQGFAKLNEEDLRMIASETGGRFVYADSAQELNNVYSELKQTLMWRMGRDEATALASIGAGLLLLVSIVVAQHKQRL
jgi:Ca-activated chloride channel family protein